jgi:RNA polymerase sigma-70 factor (TIGR02943 family)
LRTSLVGFAGFRSKARSVPEVRIQEREIGGKDRSSPQSTKVAQEIWNQGSRSRYLRHPFFAHFFMSDVKIQTAASRWVDEHGECLYRYALVRVRTPEVAEDLVQETLLAAMRGYEKFGGRSSERSWLCGILKNKIVDHFRKLGRETSFTDMEFLNDEFSEKFVSVGFWDHEKGPHEWKPAPDEVMHRAEFWQTMKDCLAKLPQKVRDVFTMREMDDISSKEICAILSISDSNLWVMLHRARMALRECLEMNWFDKPVGGRA